MTNAIKLLLQMQSSFLQFESTLQYTFRDIRLRDLDMNA
jgi:hypothetical protein